MGLPHPNLIDLKGRWFGRLRVIKRIGRNKQRSSTWLCCCSCGAERIISSASLQSSNTKSCGCLHREQSALRKLKHGGFGTRLYRIWFDMRRRCRNPQRKAFPRYGGRGIKVCKAWQTFEAFRDWALKHGYQDDLTIDRINNDGNYTPSNCRWISLSENSAKGNVSTRCVSAASQPVPNA